MLNYFFTIKSHIIDLFMVGRVMQYRFEIDVPLVVGVVHLGVGDRGGFVVVVIMAYWYIVVASWASGWPLAISWPPLVWWTVNCLVVVLVNQQSAGLCVHHQISHYRFIYGGHSHAV